MRRALTQSVPRRGLSHIQGRALRLTPLAGGAGDGAFAARGLCCTGPFPRTGARFLSAAVCGKKAAAHKPPGGGAEGVATPQKAEDEKAPMAGWAADMGACLYDVPDVARAFLHSPGGRGGFPAHRGAPCA